MKRIIHISPALPPMVNGLGDFCKILVQNLEHHGYIDNIFMVKALSASAGNIYSFHARNLVEQLSRLQADVVILHYVGYAYERRGLPFYIVSALRNCKMHSGVRVLVYFHELYATSRSLFKLSFYTSGLQKLIVRQLCEISDVVFTNCEAYCEELKRVAGIDAVRTGLFSNIPEALYDRTATRQRDSLVVFGSLPRRKAVYQNDNFESIIERLQITNVYDIGPGTIEWHRPGIVRKVMGPLDPVRVAQCLNKVCYGALSYKPHLLGKSGIFSAYAAFGVIPFNVLTTDYIPEDGLTEGENYFTWRTIDVALALGVENARAEVLKWYESRNQERVTEKIKSYV